MSEPHEQVHMSEVKGEGTATFDHSTDLDTALARRKSPRHRLVTAALVGAALLVAVGLVLRGLLPAPAAPAVASPSVAVMSNVSFGTISINGRQLTRSSHAAALLRTGSNTLMLDAPPFRVPPCTIRWPLTNPPQAPRRGDCLILGNPTDGPAPGVTIMLFAGGYDLPPTPRAGALAAVALSYANIELPVLTAPAGNYFATGIDAQGHIVSQRATTTLIATPSLEPALATDPVSEPQMSELTQTCAQLDCPITAPTPPTRWGAQLVRWQRSDAGLEVY